MKEQHIYHTSDTSEAAYLMSHGVQLLNTEFVDRTVTFTLKEMQDGQIGQLLIKWGNGCSEQNFYRTYRKLLRIIKGQQQNVT